MKISRITEAWRRFLRFWHNWQILWRQAWTQAGVLARYDITIKSPSEVDLAFEQLDRRLDTEQAARVMADLFAEQKVGPFQRRLASRESTDAAG